MKKYRWVLTAVFAAFLVGTSGCGKKTETIPITTISQSTDDDDPEDNLAASGDSDEIPEYDVDLSKNLNSFQLAIWGDTYEIPESYADFTALGWVYSGDDAKEIQPEIWVTTQPTKHIRALLSWIAHNASFKDAPRILYDGPADPLRRPGGADQP